jgi:hypothetical protein
MIINNYIDFYVGSNYVFNVRYIFRDPKNILQPNYINFFIDYYNYVSNIVISKILIYRPNGQIIFDKIFISPILTFVLCRNLDIKFELGCFLINKNEIGIGMRIKKKVK